MKKFSDFNLLDFGHTIQVVGFVLAGNGETIVVPFPDETILESELVPSGRIGGGVRRVIADLMELSTEEWEKMIYQSDVLDVELEFPKKAIVRKSQRQIDQSVSWTVFERDGYRCRYCGQKAPLTVDHVDLWESGGASVVANLISSCRKCNRTRGRMPYTDWLTSAYYIDVSMKLTYSGRVLNEAVALTLGHLKTLRTDKTRSR